MNEITEELLNLAKKLISEIKNEQIESIDVDSNTYGDGSYNLSIDIDFKAK